MVAVRERLKLRSQRRPVRLVPLPLPRTESVPAIGALERCRPDLEITGERTERRICKQVEPTREMVVSDGLLNCGNQLATSPALVGLAQGCMLRRNRVVRSTKHIRCGRPMHVAEQRKDDRAENSNPDQRPLECR